MKRHTETRTVITVTPDEVAEALRSAGNVMPSGPFESATVSEAGLVLTWLDDSPTESMGPTKDNAEPISVPEKSETKPVEKVPGEKGKFDGIKESIRKTP